MNGSCRYIIVRLHPLYQQFLKGWFDCFEPIFSFPKRHDLLMALGTYTQKKPIDYIIKASNQKDDHEFMIELPWLEHKNPDTYNYLSENALTHFASNVRSYYRLQFHLRMSDLLIKKPLIKAEFKFDIEACIDIWMEENFIDPAHRETIMKEFQRWRKNERQRKYRHKKRKYTAA